MGLMCPVWAAFKVPNPRGYVTDLAEVISPESEDTMTRIAEELQEKTTAEIAVLTVDTLDGTPVEDAALQTFREWGVGSKETNNGLLILVAVSDHQMRTEVGYGLEGTIPDGLSGEIQDSFMIPAFREGDYDKGILQGTAAYAQKVAEGYEVTLDTLSGELAQSVEEGYQTTEEPPPPFVILLIIGFILLISVLQFLGILPSTRRGYYGGYGGHSGGFGGGGFGGFGGGSSGGGGSSRGW